MAAVGIVALLFGYVALTLVVGSGAGRFHAPDDSTMMWVGFACFGVFCLIGLAIKATGRGPAVDTSRPAAALAGFGLLLVAVAVGVGLDIAN